MLIHAIVKVLFGHYREMYKFCYWYSYVHVVNFCRLFGHGCTWFWLFTHAKKIFLNRGQCTNPMKRRLAFNEWTAEKFAKSLIESFIWAKVWEYAKMKVPLMNILCKTCQISEIDHLLEVICLDFLRFLCVLSQFQQGIVMKLPTCTDFCMFSLLTPLN